MQRAGIPTEEGPHIKSNLGELESWHHNKYGSTCFRGGMGRGCTQSDRRFRASANTLPTRFQRCRHQWHLKPFHRGDVFQQASLASTRPSCQTLGALTSALLETRNESIQQRNTRAAQAESHSHYGGC